MSTKSIERKAFILARREAHQRALETLHAMPDKANGLKMWRALRKLETLANAHATYYCNGRNGSGFEYGAENWENFLTLLMPQVEKIFGHVPKGFFVNGDARGHALKLDSEKVKIPDGMETDWGRDGILAAMID